MKQLTSHGQNIGGRYNRDGSKIVFEHVHNDLIEIWILTVKSRIFRKLTIKRDSNQTSIFSPSFSPNGEKIAFVSSHKQHTQIYTTNIDGSAQMQLTATPQPNRSPVWSPDGQKIVFFRYFGKIGQIYVMNADGTHQKRIPFINGASAYPDWR